MDAGDKRRVVCLWVLWVEDTEDGHLFGLMRAGLLLIGGGALVYRRVGKTAAHTETPVQEGFGAVGALCRDYSRVWTENSMHSFTYSVLFSLNVLCKGFLCFFLSGKDVELVSQIWTETAGSEQVHECTVSDALFNLNPMSNVCLA